MKYIITESKLDRVIFRYLDMKLDSIELKKGNISDIVFAFPGEEYGLIAWNKTDVWKEIQSPNQLFTYYKIVDEVKNMFSMDKYDTLNVIGRYVESRYNLKVSYNSDKSMFVQEMLEVKVDE